MKWLSNILLTILTTFYLPQACSAMASSSDDIVSKLKTIKDELVIVKQRTTEFRNSLTALKAKLGASTATTRPQPTQPTTALPTYQELNTQYSTLNSEYYNQFNQVSALPLPKNAQVHAQCLDLLDKQWNYLLALSTRLHAINPMTKLTNQQVKAMTDLLTKTSGKQKEISTLLAAKPAPTPLPATPTPVPTPPPATPTPETTPVATPGTSSNIPKPPPPPPVKKADKKKNKATETPAPASKPKQAEALTPLEEIRITGAVIDVLKSIYAATPTKNIDEARPLATKAATDAGASAKDAQAMVERALNQKMILVATNAISEAYKKQPPQSDADVLSAAVKAVRALGANKDQATKLANIALKTNPRPTAQQGSLQQALEKSFEILSPAIRGRTPEEEAAEDAADAAEWED